MAPLGHTRTHSMSSVQFLAFTALMRVSRFSSGLTSQMSWGQIPTHAWQEAHTAVSSRNFPKALATSCTDSWWPVAMALGASVMISTRMELVEPCWK